MSWQAIPDIPSEQLLDGTPEQKALLRFLDILVDGPFVLAQRNLDLCSAARKTSVFWTCPKSLAAGRAVWCTAPRWVGERQG